MTQVLADPPTALAPAESDAPAADTGVLGRCRPSAERAAAAARALGLNADPAPTPEAPAHKHLRVVAPGELSPAQRRRRARALLIGSAMVALAVAFALVYFHVVLAQRQFRVDNLNNQLQQQQLTYQKLRLQVAELGSPQNIISTAEGKLGMHQPNSVTYLSPSTTIGSGGSSGRGSTAGATKTSQGPAGDANWPAIKSQLAGSP